MGMDLRGNGGTFRLNWFGWNNMLKLAHMNGWRPAGTLAPEPWKDDQGRVTHEFSDWGGSYFSNSYQAVATEDARNIADALEQSLDDLPNHGALEHKCGLELPGGLVLKDAIKPECEKSLTPMEVFSGEGKQTVRDFIEYCRAGSFVIG